MSALVVLLAYFAISSWARGRWNNARTLYERDVGSLDLRAWEIPDVPYERNAATWIAKGAMALALKLDKHGASKLRAAILKPPANWNTEDLATLLAAVEAGRDAMDVLARAQRLEESSFGIPLEEGAAAKLPDLLEILSAADLVYAHGSLAVRDGNRAAAISDVALLGSIARALEREAVSLVTLVGLVVERRQLRLAQAIVQAPEVTVPELDEVKAHVLRNDIRALFARSLAADGAVNCSDLRDRGLGVAFPALRVIAGNAVGAFCLDAYGTVLPILDTPPAEVEERYQRSLIRLRGSWGHRLVSDPTVPNVFKGAIRAWTNVELRRLTNAAVSLRSRALMSGAYAADLDELPADAVPEPEGPGAWTYEQFPGGAVRLSAPDSATLASKGFVPESHEDLPFVWTLPPPR